jgi:hypothetical protein
LISVVSGGLDAVKNFLDIHSPSRVFRDVVGANIVKGVSVGIELESPNMNKQLEDSFKSLSNVKVSGLVSKLKASVNSQMAISSTSVVASKINVGTSDSTNSNNDVPEGSTFIVKNYMDSDEISEYTYKKVDGKFAIAGKRVR